MSKSIDIILPMYNPPVGWADLVTERYTQLEQTFPSVQFDLIVVNDGSTSAEADNISGLKRHITGYSENRGKGYALRHGVRKSDADYIVYTDIDFPYMHESMIEVISILLEGDTSIVIGGRGKAYYANLPASRKWISYFLRSLNKRLLGLKVSDTQGGLKGFDQKGKQLFLKTKINRYLFDLEFIYLGSHDSEIQIRSVDVALRDGVTFTSFKFGILFQEGLNFLKVLFRI